MNKIIAIGHVGKDPEVRTFDNGGKVANFSLGCTERGYKTKEGKDIPDHTEWFDCVARNGLANIVEQYIKKGSHLFVSGKIKSREYEKKEGGKAKIKELIVDEIKMLSPKQETVSSYKDDLDF